MNESFQEPTPAPTPPPSGPIPSADERQWAMFAHLSALAGGALSSAFGGIGVFVGPLVIWLLKRETMPFVDDQGKEALNFNLTLAIIAFVLFLLSVLTLGLGFIVTIPIFVILGIGWLALTIVAAIRSQEGKAYRYPLTWRIIR